MPGPLSRLLRREPEIELRMLTANTRELLSLLDQGELDFAIVEGNFDRQFYEGLAYCTQRFLPVCAPGYPFPRPVRTMEDLLDVHLLAREPGSGTRSVLERVLEAHNLAIQNFHRLTELGSLNLIKNLACAGVGVTFLYQPVVQQELQQGLLQEIPLEEGPFCHDFTFLWRRGSAFAGEYRAMFQLLRQ